MVSLLLIISFLLHLISLYAIYQLFQYVKKQERDGNDMTHLFESYLQEFKEENSILKEQIRNNKHMESPSPNQKKVVMSEKKSHKKEEAVAEETRDEDAFKPLEMDREDEVEASLESRVLQLESQGFLSGEIAKKLECGKTEVELIINLYKKRNTNA